MTNQTITEEFFAGNGEMAALMRAFDWASTPIGSAATWPQSLKTTVRIMLTSRYAMWMAWGKELTFFCNDAYRPTLGVKSSWALGAPATEVWAEIWPDIGPRIEKVLHTGEATWDEALMLFLERSGYTEETYHTFSYSPLADDSGTISGMLCVVTEETERVIGERRLALLQELASTLASAQTLADVAGAIDECLETNMQDLPFTLTYLFDDEGSTVRLVAATGIPAGSEIAVPIIGPGEGDAPWPLQAILSEHVPMLIEDLAERFEWLPCGSWNKPPQQALIVPMAQQGQERPAGFLVAALNPYRRLDAEYQGFINLLVGQIASSLANVQAYEEERKRAEALAELDRAKTAFFSNVSHEFRTPLTLMLGPLEDALAASEPALTGTSLQTVHRNGLRLLKLVNTLLDFARFEAGRVQASYEPTDLATYTGELASLFRSAVEKAGMRLLVDCPPLSQPVYIDRDMWEKVVLNLVSNAFKFTLEGEIAVMLREQDQQAVLSVRDTGTGITKEQLPHIFERFHRVEGTRARTHEGTGIGLALVLELAKLHGGIVNVESEVGVGTTFTVSIPLGSAHLPGDRISAPRTLASTALHVEAFVEEAQRWLPEEDSSPNVSYEAPLSPHVRVEDGNRPHIILADDNADMREYVRRLLQHDYQVTAVANGAEALQAATETKPSLVISDVMMPELDGFGLLKELRSEPHTASTPIILLSARAGEEARIEGLTAGADDYLVKPFSARELLARVASHLELARVRREYETSLAEMNVRLQRAMTETHHRVKNNLQLISALIDMQQATGESSIPMSEVVRLGANVRALGVIHDILTQEARAGRNQESLSIKAVLERLIQVLRQTTGGRALSASFDDARLAGRQATTLALVTNELISNALKHGKGTVEISFTVNNNAGTLEVCDDGPGFPAGFDVLRTTNTGLELVEHIVQWDLRGQIVYENRVEGGARRRVTFPINT
jgi:signal transduction histidine kinase